MTSRMGSSISDRRRIKMTSSADSNAIKTSTARRSRSSRNFADCVNRTYYQDVLEADLGPAIYTDSSVQAGLTYFYVATSVGTNSVKSTYSKPDDVLLLSL